MRKRNWVKINGVDLNRFALGVQFYISDILVGTSEKKNIGVEVPFRDGTIWQENIFDNKNHFRDIPLSFTVAVVTKNHSRSETYDIGQLLIDNIVVPASMMRVEVSDREGDIFTAKHTSTEVTKAEGSEGLVYYKFNFLALPFVKVQIGGYGYCDLFDEATDWCESDYYYKTNTSMIYELNFHNEVTELVINVDKDCTVSINGKNVALIVGNNTIIANQLQMKNTLKYNLANVNVFVEYEQIKYI
ncbi:hypothetical protein [Culicoidibacter larvae]|uniref:Uncharacterized protein n=1 Tax=Culicoidibacter larvae TaxID=2579976 RepID=A0A5R8Q8K2_9FIRM|nr:hypothetical protein [Culicoidibacter larvae]TLG72044.1 hypothetical protein FEZ08_09430 [Culicoidibacter larvae]